MLAQPAYMLFYLRTSPLHQEQQQPRQPQPQRPVVAEPPNSASSSDTVLSNDKSQEPAPAAAAAKQLCGMARHSGGMQASQQSQQTLVKDAAGMQPQQPQQQQGAFVPSKQAQPDTGEASSPSFTANAGRAAPVPKAAQEPTADASPQRSRKRAKVDAFKGAAEVQGTARGLDQDAAMPDRGVNGHASGFVARESGDPGAQAQGSDALGDRPSASHSQKRTADAALDNGQGQADARAALHAR